MSDEVAKNPVIGTCTGTYSCNEVFACGILKCLPQYKEATIVRSQDKNILDKCDLVVGVGGIYDPSTHRYDYHAEGFWQTARSVMNKWKYDNEDTLISPTLIFCHFGYEITKTLFPAIEHDKIVEDLSYNIYTNYIVKCINDNDYLEIATEHPYFHFVEDPAVHHSKKVSEDELFNRLVLVEKCNFLRYTDRIRNSRCSNRDLVRNAVNNRFSVDPSGEIIELLQLFTWEKHLFELEKELKLWPSIKFVIISDICFNRALSIIRPDDDVKVRITFPNEWAGLQDDELEEVCGIKGAISVGDEGYTAEHETRDGALAMAQEALRIGNSPPPEYVLLR